MCFHMREHVLFIFIKKCYFLQTWKFPFHFTFFANKYDEMTSAHSSFVLGGFFKNIFSLFFLLYCISSFMYGNILKQVRKWTVKLHLSCLNISNRSELKVQRFFPFSTLFIKRESLIFHFHDLLFSNISRKNIQDALLFLTFYGSKHQLVFSNWKSLTCKDMEVPV